MTSLLLLAMIVSLVALYSTIDASPVLAMEEETSADVDPLAEIEVNLKLDIFLKDKNTFQHRYPMDEKFLIPNDTCAVRLCVTRRRRDAWWW